MIYQYKWIYKFTRIQEYITQGWGKYIDSVLGYKYIKNVQVQIQVQGFAKCTWVLPKYIVGTTQVHCKCTWVQLPSTKYKCII